MTFILHKLLTLVLAVNLFATGAICICAAHVAGEPLAKAPPCCRHEPKGTHDDDMPASNHAQCASRMPFVNADYAADASVPPPLHALAWNESALLSHAAPRGELTAPLARPPAETSTLLRLHCALIV